MFILAVIVFFKTGEKEKVVYRNIETNIEFYKNNIDRLSNLFEDRYVIKDKDGLSIGKSKNELENGYYDIKLVIKEKYIEIYINKLFKEFDNNIIYDEKYVNQIIEYIVKLFNFKLDKEKMVDLVISNYLLIRDIDRNNVENVDKSVEINNYKVALTVDKNILVLKIGDKNV